VSAPFRPTGEPDWAAHPAGGWSEFRAARARFLATMAAQSSLVRLERSWGLPTRDPRAGSGVSAGSRAAPPAPR
jgi:hypothetical protein